MDALVYALLAILAAVLAAVLVGWIRMMSYYDENSTRRFPRTLVSQADLAPGDLLLFIPHAHGFTNSLLTRNYYSHVAIVVREPASGRLCVAESNLGEIMPDPQRPGREVVSPGESDVLPLYARLKYYPGQVFWQKLVPPASPAQARALWERAQCRNGYPDLIQGFFRSFFPGSANERHCMAHAAWLLDGAGLTPRSHLKKGETLEGQGFFGVCRQVTRLHEAGPLGQSGRQKYRPPVALLYDLDASETARSENEPQETRRGASERQRSASGAS